MKRPSIPPKTQVTILSKCRRRCAFCYYFEFDTSLKKGQIAHIDRNRNNNVENNLVYLCLPHHDDYDTKSIQTKRYTPEELAEAKRELETFIEKKHSSIVSLLASDKIEPLAKKSKINRVSVEVYKIRYPIYQAFRDFVIPIVQNTDIDIEKLYEFRTKTHDTLFLYDHKIEQVFQEIDKKAITFHHYQRQMKKPDNFSSDEWSQLVEKETEILLWFSETLVKGRDVFTPYLRIADR